MGHTAVYIAQRHNPWFNLATETWLIEKSELKDKHILYLWRNSPCIVIGRYQNPWVECNLQAMERDGVLLARRLSGGGAVYQDLGNTCFTIISPREQYDKGRNFDIVRKALAACGVESELSGRNDILVDGRKVSGSAFQLTSTRGCHHGTLLIEADLSHIGEYLTPDKQKLEAKGIRSVASRVANLQDLQPAFNHERFQEAVIDAFRREYGEESPIQGLDTALLEREPLLMDMYGKLSADSWRFGTTPQFSHVCSERLPWGRLTFHLDVEKGVVAQAKVFSDALSTACVEILEDLLPGLPYTPQAIRRRVADVAGGLPDDLAALVEEGSEVLLRDMEG